MNMSLTLKTLSVVSVLFGLYQTVLVAETSHSTDNLTPDEVKKRVCEIPAMGVLNEVKIPSSPSYFFKVLPEGDWIGYIDSGNHMLNMKTKEKKKTPGGIDPVFTPDGKYYVTPGVFYRTEDVLAKGSSAPSFYSEGSSSYQSLGILSSDSEKTTYRYFAGYSMRDYEITHNPSGTPSVKPLGSSKTLCPGVSYSLPMLSKDGKFLSAIDNGRTPRTTHVWEINDDGTCKEVQDLGIGTGKVEFSFDNDWMAFHVFNNENRNAQFSQPDDNQLGNIYVYQRSTGKFQRLTSNTSFSSVYPSWKKDGSLVYLNHHYNHGEDNRASFVHVATPAMSETELKDVVLSPGKSENQQKEWYARLALGGLWGVTCSEHSVHGSALHAVLEGLSIGKKECELLIQTFWAAKKETVATRYAGHKVATDTSVEEEKIKRLSEDDLKKVCSKTDRTIPPPPPLKPPAPIQPAKPPKVRAVPDSCRQCHPRIPFDDLEKLRAMKSHHSGEKPMIDEILRLVKSKDPDERMPQGGPAMTEEQIAELERYLRGSGTPPSATPPSAPGNPNH